MTFVYRKGESGKGRKMDGAKTPVAKIQSLAKITFNLRLISHLGECACLMHALPPPCSMMNLSMEWRTTVGDSQIAAFLVSMYRAFNTPEIVITLRGICG
jgi:hypothetical protein